MNGKSMGMLSVAVLCGLGAMYGTSKLISKEKGQPVVEMQDVLVAARDLKLEEVIRPDMVKVVQMAKTAVPAGAFSSIKDVEERWVQHALLENEPVVDRKLAPRGSPPGLIARIPKGMRAFAIEVNEQTGVSGFVLPDHRVDVVQTETGPNGQSEAESVLQDVLVLASGQTFTRPDDRSIQSRTVTLAVTPEQVDILVAAKSRGPLTLALRGLNDHTQAPSKKKEREKAKEKEREKAAASKEVVAVKAPEPPPPPPPPVAAPTPPPSPARFVAIYRGLDNMRRLRIDQAGDATAGGEAAPAAPAASTAPAAVIAAPATTDPMKPAGTGPEAVR
jgi:pilus assembly protein CpaB